MAPQTLFGQRLVSISNNRHVTFAAEEILDHTYRLPQSVIFPKSLNNIIFWACGYLKYINYKLT